MASLRQTARAAILGLPGLFWVLWGGLLVNRAASFVAALLGIYLVRERGFGAAEAGQVVSLWGAGFIVAGPLGGLLADRIGRRPVMLAGLLCGAAAVGALVVARSPALLALLAFLSSAAGELYRPAAHAALTDVVPVAERARAWGLVYWAVNFGMAVGLLLAAIVAERSLGALFLADAGTTLLFAGLVAARVPETRPAAVRHEPALAGLARVLRDRAFVVFLGLYLASLVVFTQWQLGLPLDMAAHGLGPSAFSVLLGLNCAGVVLLQPLLGARLRGHDPSRLLAASALLFGAGFGVNALGGGLPVYALGTACWTVGEVVGFPAAAALVADLAPVELRGRYQGAFSMSWGVAFTLSPVLAGQVVSRLGGRALWLACLAIAVAVALGYLATGEERRRRVAEARRSADPAVSPGG
ncbi:MFS transporter [Anaeromyxobacter diazotrophicus]|uniref:MFS transporter n=1 Tax=Anaeromyxobacter diazotrophicus TaxID=2590199 RepID=A0A7I9VLS4_9BACT|nr:MFS transporter [Anaeromyxobacter diazotrophicus]GEJ57354.1 MFS transporter [Anaeromyxobacter diazotrophicus]